MKNFLLSLTLATLILTGASAQSKPDNRITIDSVAGIRLGMTLEQARQARPDLQFSSQRGPEVIWFVAKEKDRELFRVYAGPESGEIEFIEIFDESFKTAQGVHPGMSLSDAEKQLGTLSEITKSEIESREYARFANGGHFIYRVGRLDGEAGIYEDPRSTKRYHPNSKISNIGLDQQTAIRAKIHSGMESSVKKVGESLKVDLDGYGPKDEVSLVKIVSSPPEEVTRLTMCFESEDFEPGSYALWLVLDPGGLDRSFLINGFPINSSWFQDEVVSKGVLWVMRVGHGPDKPEDAQGDSIMLDTESGAGWYIHWNGEELIDSNQGDQP